MGPAINLFLGPASYDFKFSVMQYTCGGEDI